MASSGGIRGQAGNLVAVAVKAWSSPGWAFLHSSWFSNLYYNTPPKAGAKPPAPCGQPPGPDRAAAILRGPAMSGHSRGKPPTRREHAVPGQRRRGAGHRHAPVPGIAGRAVPGTGPGRRRGHGPHGHVRAFGPGSPVPPARPHGGRQPEGRLRLHPHHLRHGELAAGTGAPPGEQVRPRARRLLRPAAAPEHAGRHPRWP